MEWDPGGVWSQVAARLDIDGPVSALHLPAAPPTLDRWPEWVPAEVRGQLRGIGIEAPYRHQRLAAEAAWEGEDVALATGTATGKSLAYLLPILSSAADRELQPPTALYLAPTKALAHDQLRALHGFDLPGLRPAAYDGDTPPEERRWTRRHASVVVSNPDMVHAGILPAHPGWESFLRRLRFLVVDEFHVYRGLFGANLAAVLRRLLRVASHYGARPAVIGTSATVADPADTLGTITGRPARSVQHGALARTDTELLLVPPQQGGLLARTADVFAALVAQQVRTLAFVRSRRAAEVVSLLAAEQLAADGLGHRVASYRSGYLPEERRELERGLRDGRYTGLAATSALELGIDISGLDAVVVAGWPGTRAALRQRLGRAGRDRRPALAVFLADNNPLDTHLVRNPGHLVAGLEGMVIDSGNPYVLGPHLCAAAAELPLTDGEAASAFGEAASQLLPALGERGLLRRRPTGWYWTRPDRPWDLADIRGGTGSPVSVVEQGTGRLIGSVDAAAADRTVHPGAVYTHQGRDYLISDFDASAAVATADPAALPYWTQPQTLEATRLLQILQSASWGPVAVHYGIVEVASQVVGFRRRRTGGGEVLGSEPLALPVRTLRTKAVWWTVPGGVIADAGVPAGAVAGAAHAAEHAAIGLLPLYAHCDRWDVGGLSTPEHPDTGQCTIVVHDGLPGGAGFAERGFGAARTWLQGTLAAVAGCPCEQGCPGCVQSPKCGSGNEPLDKAAAVALMAAMLGQDPPRD